MSGGIFIHLFGFHTWEPGEVGISCKYCGKLVEDKK